jgi:hypothetical protein
MPGSGESAQKAPTGGRFLPQRPRRRKHAAGSEWPNTAQKIRLWRPLPAAAGATADGFGSLFPDPAPQARSLSPTWPRIRSFCRIHRI